MPSQRRRLVGAAALLLVPLTPLARAADMPFLQTVYAASAQCTVDGSNWILYLGDQTAPYAWDAAASPDGSAFRDRAQQMHIHTTTPMQSLTCQLYGTRISVLGGLQLAGGVNAADPNFLSITLDGQPVTPDALTLTPANDTWKSTVLQAPPPNAAPLTPGMHTLQIQTGASFHGALKMWGMVANTSVQTAGWKPYSAPGVGSSTGHELPFVFNSSVASTMYNWGDRDPGVHNFGLQNVSSPEMAVAVREKAEATVNLPKNSSYLVLHGYSGPNYGTLWLDIEPAPPGVSTLPVERNTNKPWLVYDTLFEVPLDPTAEYTVTYTTKEGALGAGVYLASTGVLEYQENTLNPFTGGWKDGTKPKKRNLGPFIGGAVGGGIGAILLVGLIVFLWRRRRAAKNQPAISASEEGSSDGTLGESDAMLEKDGSARASLRPSSMGGRPKSGVSDRRKSEMAMMLERDKRKSVASTKSGRKSRRQSEMPAHVLSGDYRKDLESWLLPSGAYSGGALRQSRPISSTSGRGLLDGLAVPAHPLHSRPISSSSGRGLLDGLNVPPNPRNSRPVSSPPGRGLPPLDIAAAAPASPPPNLSPVEQTLATLTGKLPQSPPRTRVALPPGAEEPAPAPFAVQQAASPTASGPPLSFPTPTPASPTAAGPPTHAPPSSPQPRSESVASQATFFSLPDESMDAGDTTVGSEGFFSAQSHAAPVFLQPNSSSSRPMSRQAIPKGGASEAEVMDGHKAAVDETQYVPGTAM
ncbi:hypothetical protein CC85DRAFT_328643 [Cutaneotrichosporon oleaginosum]|uniref:Galactose oxidase n=1 Tax=Cutaneotrichosporon oleaginosum TaxID=879819 RepID=A0A0J0XLG3_9TREE|nr:uncharacterized protein CC85DRAFT_328643 [Cutaneotrichosporon oleaginosum]KLT41933.1 hypothetical protein CC85DRAFT_328643 [Cutaneotrichosporon oleaginosum]TXT12533.1 hypothetical protein COLE_02943 [Cutaneotrichosporon oleaginosum]